MQRLSEKIKLIFLPFLYIAIAYPICYSLLNWLLNIKLHILLLQDDVVEIILPLVLVWIPVLIWLRRPTKILATGKKGKKPGDGLQVLAGFAIGITCIGLQFYMETSTGKMTVVNNVDSISHYEATKYYSIQNGYYIDKAEYGAYSSSKVSGKHNEDLTFQIHYVVPVLKSEADTQQRSCAAWIGVDYKKTLNNNLSDDKEKSEWTQFVDETHDKFDHATLDGFAYLKEAGNNYDHDHFLKALKSSPKFDDKNTTILLPVYEPFENHNGKSLQWTFLSFFLGSAAFFLVLLLVKIDETELAKKLEGRQAEDTGFKDLMRYFIPHKDFYITPILVDLNLAVFIFMVLRGYGFIDFPADTLKELGANYGPLTTGGEWWRLVTSTFLHSGIMHLFSNMAGLLIVGLILERATGAVKFAACYFISGIIASAASMYWHSDVVSVGASGAIFGMYGMFLALLLTKVFPKEFSKGFLIFTFIFIGFNLVMGLAKGVDNAAHVGGVLSGFIIGLILSKTITPVTSEKIKELEQQEMTAEALAKREAAEAGEQTNA